MARTATDIITRCSGLKQFWSSRDAAMRRWYRMIEMVDELKTEKLESFVGNDPRALYNLVLHMLDAKIPHRISNIESNDPKVLEASASVSKFLASAWDKVYRHFRQTNPRQSYQRTSLGFLLATGWYAEFAIVADSGEICYAEPWNPIEVYPMWDAALGLSEVAHIYKVSTIQAANMAKLNLWNLGQNIPQWIASTGKDVTIYDYWWLELADEYPYNLTVHNAIVIGQVLVKNEVTRFRRRIPIYIAPVGGLPDMGSISEGEIPTYSSTLKLQTQDNFAERWKAELGQAVIATNEHIYRTWNKWWSFSLQLLRDTAQPRVFERSRSGKAIVRPEDVFKRGAIFRGGPDDSVDFIGAPPIPLELRSTQLDLEAMMQRGGVSWSMYGNIQGQLSAYVMSQISASANQVMRPFHQAFVEKFEDQDTEWLYDIKDRGVKPYGWKYPSGLPEDAIVSANYDVEIPGDLVQRATTARMLDPDFQLSYSYVMQKLFPDISDPMQERANRRADQAEMHPTNAIIALISYYRQQELYLADIGQLEASKLYKMAADATTAVFQNQVSPQGGQGQPTPGQRQLPPGAGVPQMTALPARTGGPNA